MVNLNGDRSSSDSSPGQSSNSTYAELSEADDQFSSTPLHRKVLHVSFADEEQSGPERQTCEPSFDKIEESSLQCHQPASVDRVPAMEGEYERVWTAANGDLLAPLEAVDAGKVEGILKPYQAGGGGGGGETGQRQSMSSRESRGEGQQLQNQRGTRAGERQYLFEDIFHLNVILAGSRPPVYSSPATRGFVFLLRYIFPLVVNIVALELLSKQTWKADLQSWSKVCGTPRKFATFSFIALCLMTKVACSLKCGPPSSPMLLYVAQRGLR